MELFGLSYELASISLIKESPMCFKLYSHTSSNLNGEPFVASISLRKFAQRSKLYNEYSYVSLILYVNSINFLMYSSYFEKYVFISFPV